MRDKDKAIPAQQVYGEPALPITFQFMPLFGGLMRYVVKCGSGAKDTKSEFDFLPQFRSIGLPNLLFRVQNLSHFFRTEQDVHRKRC